MYRVLGVVFAFFVFCALLEAGQAALSCRNDQGEPIDWYNLYKLPKKISTGVHFLALTENDNDWRLSEEPIDDPQSIPGRTLSQLTDQHLVLMYNDEPPEGATDGTRGHTKGVVATDGETGFWLIHSVPKFPSKLGLDYTFPKTGTIYGQSFLCVTFNSTEMDTIGLQLHMNEPHFYEINIPEALKGSFPNLVKASDMKMVSDPPYWRLEQIKSKEGNAFSSFAKSAKFKKELYMDWVAPVLGSSLVVESWLHGPGRLETNCSIPFPILNLRDVMVHVQKQRTNFRSLDDHSKWAVALENNKDWICVGDINRAEHQMVRGGGTLCRWDKKVATAYRSTILDVEPCPEESSEEDEYLDEYDEYYEYDDFE
ncbi:plancitoxin-1 [Phlebotomus argentipes]|uniref:plancitoxin-1 n=1 Tax=Phlebotomus argentipes TaxID=94469 RepID=UPI002892DF6B|nr:plancitoxin-1 [Phlebotomus argentipes]